VTVVKKAHREQFRRDLPGFMIDPSSRGASTV
jgi:hypothetical protein